MPNPERLLFDCDALIQLLMAKQGGLLAHLRQTYRITAAVLPEVEIEVCQHRKFRNQFEQPFLRLVQNGHINVLESEDLRRLLVDRGVAAARAAEEVRAALAAALRYRIRVGRGEAHCHAVAVALQLPLVSHDWHAVEVLQLGGEAVAVPVLGLFDLLALGLDDGVVNDDECDRVVRDLVKNSEWVPSALRKLSPDVRTAFGRLNKRLERWAGTGAPPQPQGPKDVLYLVRE